MTHTVLSSPSKQVTIGFDKPFTMIGERINPTGRKILAAEMKVGDYSRVEADAIAQVQAQMNLRYWPRPFVGCRPWWMCLCV